MQLLTLLTILSMFGKKVTSRCILKIYFFSFLILNKNSVKKAINAIINIINYFIDVWFVIILLTFGLSSVLLRRGVVHRYVTTFYPYKGDLDNNTDLISRKYQIMIFSMLKN